MGKKGKKKDKKSSTSSKDGASSGNKWEAELLQAPFEEESWQACVTMVVGESPVEEDLLPAMVSVKPQRKLFTSLTCDEAKVHEKKPADRPKFCEVTEVVKKLTDAGQEIPCDLMAKLVKFHLLRIKANDQQRRADEQVEAENAAGPSDIDATTVAKKGAKEKKTKLKRRDYVEPPKYIDDEPEDGPQHYILLMGFYQPELIRELNNAGVHVANVIEMHSQHIQTLESLEEPEEPDDLQSTEQSPEDSSVLDEVSATEDNDEGADKLAEHAKALDDFWSGLRSALESGPPDSKLQDVVQLSFTVSDHLLSLDKQNPEAVCELGRHVSDGVANLIYNCVKWRRQHQHYQNNLKLFNIPTVERDLLPDEKSDSKHEQEAEVSKLSVDVDMTYYHSLLDRVPPETCSVPLMLHCMLEQICMDTSDNKVVSSAECDVKEKSKSKSKGPWLSPDVVSDMLNRFLPLVHTEEDKSCIINDLIITVQQEEDKKSVVENFGGKGIKKMAEEVVVIRHHNERELRLRDVNAVEGFDPVELEVSMMRGSSVCEMIQTGSQHLNNNTSGTVLTQQLRHYCTDDVMSWSDVEHLIHQSVFEAMPLTTVTEHSLKPPGTPPGLCWDDPLLYVQQKITQTKGSTCVSEDSDNTEQFNAGECPPLDVSDMQRCRLRSLFDWYYTEHHDASVFPQVLQAASEEYHCLDTFRGSKNDKFFIFCHNPMNHHRQSKEVWNVSVHTDVRFRRYLEHVAETISDWTREEQKKLEKTQIKASKSPTESVKDEIDQPAEKEELPLSLEPIIRKESLKAWKLEQGEEPSKTNNQTKKDDGSKGKKKEKSPSADNESKSKKKDKAKSADKESKSKKKDKAKSADNESKGNKNDKSASARKQSPTTPPEDVKEEEQHPEEPMDVPVDEMKPFTGVNMDGKLIHVSGQLQRLYPSDGGQITVETTSFVEGSSLLKIALKKDGHHFFTYINQVVDVVKAVPAPQDETPAPQDETPAPQDEKPADPESTDNECEKVKPVKQGSLSALLDNGIRLSYSSYGPTGKSTGSPTPPLTINPVIDSTETNGEKSPDTTDDLVPTDQSTLTDPQTQPSEDTPQHAQGDTSPAGLETSPLKSLNVSVPNGLLLQFLPDDSQAEENGVLIRQSFPLHATTEEQRHLHGTSLSKEESRLITSKGVVIRSMRDGSTEVLFADGSVSFSQDSGPVWLPDSELQEVISGEKVISKKKAKHSKEMEDDEEERGCWCTTTPSGHRISTVGTTHELIPTSPLLNIKTVDPVTQQVMVSREDLVVCVQNPDGSVNIDHADGTRITSFFRDKCQNTSSHHLLLTGDQQTVCKEQPEITTNQSSSSVSHGVQDDITGETSDRLDIISDEKECKDISEPEIKEENGERDEKMESNKEQVVLVEKESYATVVIYPQQHLAHAFLADGTVITGNKQGEYEVFPSSKGLLRIQSDGKCVYTSDLCVASSPGDESPSKTAGIYTMSHTDNVACEVTDMEGNCFKVMDDGQVSVLNHGSAPRTAQQDEEKEREVSNDGNYPRLFMVHKDGSATELLNSHVVEEHLYQAYTDPKIALLKEPLTDTQDEFGITILKPSPDVCSQWLGDKQNPDITPPNLTNRSWNNFPRVEKKSPGPQFGTNAGRGLNVHLGGSSSQTPPVYSCPKVLEIRELYQHRPLTTPLKDVIDSRIKDFLQILMMRELKFEKIKPEEPHTGEDSAHSFTDVDDTSPSVYKTTSVDMASLYSQGIGAPTEHSDVSDDTTTIDTDSLDSFKCPSDGKYSKWNERLGEIRFDLSEERMLKDALREKKAVPFFHPDNIDLYESMQQYQKPDMRSLSQEFTPIKSKSEKLLPNDVPQGSTPRPLNPTPSQSASHGASRGRKPEKRPTNPTPQSPDKSSVRASGRPCTSLQVDVTGRPRKTKVRLPACILSAKPDYEPNPQFCHEEPVRRRCRLISLVDPTVIIRGFELLPSRVDFGTVQEGTCSSVTVIMRNVGVDTCRFQIKQPSSITGLRLIYNHGPVPAGLHVELMVQFFAMRVVQTGEAEPQTSISEDIIIHTETEILHLPVTANILCNPMQ